MRSVWRGVGVLALLLSWQAWSIAMANAGEGNPLRAPGHAGPAEAVATDRLELGHTQADQPESDPEETGQVAEHAAGSPPPAPQNRLRPAQVARPARPSKKTVKPTLPAARAAAFEPLTKRRVLYATNRRVEQAKGEFRFPAEAAAELSFGECEVQVPVEHHQPGTLELPGWLTRDKSKCFTVTGVRTMTGQRFSTDLSGQDLLLFVHGYNNEFTETAVRAAQLQHDTQFAGQALIFSWPSAGNSWSYRHDETMATQSVAALTQLLTSVLSRPLNEPGKVHIVAHSMGVRLLANAMNQVAQDLPAEEIRSRLGCVVLAAADADKELVAQALPCMVQSSGRVAYYYSGEDVALYASRCLFRHEPAGLEPIYAEGVETINADPGNSIFRGCGHEYYAACRQVLLDMNLSLNQDLPAGERYPPLRKLEGESTDGMLYTLTTEGP